MGKILRISKNYLNELQNPPVTNKGSNLKLLLCQSKAKLLPNSCSGLCKLKCTCNSTYFGETKKKIFIRTIEHQQDSFKGKWDNSGATEHTLTCLGQFNSIHAKTITRENDYRKRKIWEAQESKEAKCNKKIKVVNKDKGNLVKTNTTISQCKQNINVLSDLVQYLYQDALVGTLGWDVNKMVKWYPWK